MNAGKLYLNGEEGFVADISYRLFGDGRTGITGEFVPAGYERLRDGAGYIVELEDSHRIACRLSKNVNRVAAGLPPRFVYRFTGSKVETLI